VRKIWHRSALPGAGIVVVFAGLLALTVSLRPAFAAPRQPAHQRAIDVTLKTQEIFVIADVSWQFS